ncbi:chromatin remodelling complex Rsc7/Swp82 subunit-domain-containing protein [Pisolithus croceorrhizus]|nr:chromatin remodelling complex Rsc7/Swp82 subunit-domain-containing protein [Pisolithus croceorrhizus]
MKRTVKFRKVKPRLVLGRGVLLGTNRVRVRHLFRVVGVGRVVVAEVAQYRPPHVRAVEAGEGEGEEAEEGVQQKATPTAKKEATKTAARGVRLVTEYVTSKGMNSSRSLMRKATKRSMQTGIYWVVSPQARSSGFRDSLYYFRKNSLALKLLATQPEKEFLIQLGKLGAHLKTRSVTLVTARSAYKLHGAKMIIDGRWVTDDYYEDRALEDITSKGLTPGSPVGELPDPLATSQSVLQFTGTVPNQFSSGISHGIYRAGGPTTLFGGTGLGPFSDGPHSAVRKSLLTREGLSVENWMWEAARRVCDATEEYGKMRREARVPYGGVLESVDSKVKEKEKDGEGNVTKTEGESGNFPMGVYEPHTAIVQYRADTQPTQCRWQQVETRRVLGGTKVGNGAWALAWVDTCLESPGLGKSTTRTRLQ